MLSMTACCGQRRVQSGQETEVPSEEQNFSVSNAQEGQADIGENNILIAYFTCLDNTDATLDEIVKGGEPYGSLGDPLENADVDAIASASLTLMYGEAQGNVETMAQMIGSVTGGALFYIKHGSPDGPHRLGKWCLARISRRLSDEHDRKWWRKCLNLLFFLGWQY